jgi:hypothetical protein
MTLDFPAINRALAAVFGPGVVECLPSAKADYVEREKKQKAKKK